MINSIEIEIKIEKGERRQSEKGGKDAKNKEQVAREDVKTCENEEKEESDT